ncbi:MAG: hypothetical protein ABI072_06725, partial [Edaphobacter sp.]
GTVPVGAIGERDEALRATEEYASEGRNGPEGVPMMNGHYGHYGWMGGGMWIWVITVLVVVAFLAFIVGKQSKK